MERLTVWAPKKENNGQYRQGHYVKEGHAYIKNTELNRLGKVMGHTWERYWYATTTFTQNYLKLHSL
ncbi:hypothetical protein [Vibrio phage PhiImVa-1]|nr:hypothetical protein [Vibrio phage PhiImVa-1]